MERQIVIINVSIIKEVADEFHDKFLYDDFCLGILSTIFHEFQHLVYECNEILKIGTKEYPEKGCLEEFVEEFGNIKAENLFLQYNKLFIEREKYERL